MLNDSYILSSYFGLTLTETNTESPTTSVFIDALLASYSIINTYIVPNSYSFHNFVSSITN